MADGENPNTGPQNLHRVNQALKSMLRGKRLRARKAMRKNGKANIPRQTCQICSKMFDFAIIKVDSPVIGSRCTDCIQLLAQGWTACVSVSSYAFVRSPHFKELAGQVVRMSEENMAKIAEAKKKHEAEVPPEDAPAQN